jgi:putative PIN family toxin of toxin-antitoxin system
MDRVVLDTNVLVSVTISSTAAPDRIYQSWKRGKFSVCTSPALLEELKEVLSRPEIKNHQWMHPEEVDELISLYRRTAVLGTGEKVVYVIEDDPDDDYVLSAALETDADVIVSGDHHLLELKSFRGIDIRTPSEFISDMANAE